MSLKMEACDGQKVDVKLLQQVCPVILFSFLDNQHVNWQETLFD